MGTCLEFQSLGASFLSWMALTRRVRQHYFCNASRRSVVENPKPFARGAKENLGAMTACYRQGLQNP